MRSLDTNGPNHLGSLLNPLPRHQTARITSDSVLNPLPRHKTARITSDFVAAAHRRTSSGRSLRGLARKARRGRWLPSAVHWPLLAFPWPLTVFPRLFLGLLLSGEVASLGRSLSVLWPLTADHWPSPCLSWAVHCLFSLAVPRSFNGLSSALATGLSSLPFLGPSLAFLGFLHWPFLGLATGLSLAGHCLSLTFHRPLHRLSWPFLDLSLTFPRPLPACRDGETWQAKFDRI